MQARIIYRTYRKEDFMQCRYITHLTWPVLGSVCSDKRDRMKLMGAYFEMSRICSSWTRVALINGTAVGVLLGRINKDMTWFQHLGKLFGSLRLLFGIISGRYGKPEHPRLFIRHILKYEKMVKRNSPVSDGEIVLFFVDPSDRGKGIGKSLMNQFLSYGGNRKAEIIHLSTDEKCSWQFYEHYGFKRHCEFPDVLTAFLTGENTKGFIYTFRIPGE